MAKQAWKNDKTKCQNKTCPNKHEIHVAIFKGTGSCSVDCRKAQGIDHATQGTLTFLSRDEAALIKEAREKPFTDAIKHHNEQMRLSRG